MKESFLQEALWKEKMFNGSWMSPEGGLKDVIEPATGEIIGRVGVASPGDIGRAMESATKAQPQWGAMLGAQRAGILRKAASLLLENSKEIGKWLLRETGSIPPKVDFEINLGYLDLIEAANLCTQPVGYLLAPGDMNQNNMARREPIGVVCAIEPWNSPLVLATRAIAPALALGNAVILKPASATPISGGVVMARIFQEAGLPPGVLQVVNCSGELAEAFVTDPRVGMISFTGSTEVGKRIAYLAAPTLKKVGLELGGNNPIIILDDADLEAASSCGSFGTFFHQGQICFTAGRHIVQKKIAEKYIELLVKRAGALLVGNPNTEQVHLGPMINKKQLERVDWIVKQTIAAGAKLLTGGTYKNLFYRPTVLRDVTPEMSAFKEEIFGPVAPVTIVKDDDEAIKLANQTSYGLVAAIQTSSVTRGLHIAEQMKTGIVHINDHTICHYAQSPIGGNGDSGNGSRLGATSNLDEFTHWKWITYREKPNVYPF